MPHRLKENFHWGPQYTRLVGVRIRRRCVSSRFPFASSTRVETKVIREEYRCFNH